MAYRIGIDAGSKTLKVAVLDDADKLVFSTYIRHQANIVKTLTAAIHDLNWRLGPIEATIAMTGSAGIEVAKKLGIPFVQEVIATTKALRTYFPDADAAIELGGEDAKIIYLSGGIEQRMNASCAGGTGGFIDNIAFLLDLDPEDMSRVAFGSRRIYPIASRCAVFAQSDVRPLLNSGASKHDIAASTFEAVVKQTLGGLACGRPITGNVVFLGGPFEHMPFLAFAFRRALGLTADTGIKPRNAHLMTVLGTAIVSDSAAALNQDPIFVDTADLEERIAHIDAIESDIELLPPLFEDDAEHERFLARHDQARFPRKPLYETQGPLYVGIDAGSTTLKLVAIDSDGAIVYDYCEPVRGDLVGAMREALVDFYQKITPAPSTTRERNRTWVARCCATGYGENMLRAAFGVDMGIVETAAHLRSARELVPDLTFLLDIGGQDMKALWVTDGMVTDATLNEACSSGCGAFIEGSAFTLRSNPADFAKMALAAEHPVDLGTKCTVFMNSRVKHAQKVGAPLDDIAAGIAYSVVKNALHRIIGDDRAPSAADRVVVQGGTFRSDAVLRAFELLSDIEVTRPVEAQLMGAIGCALTARDEAEASASADPEKRSALIGFDELKEMEPVRESITCTGCANACKLTVVRLASGKGEEDASRCFISDNKCERGLDELTRRAGGEGDAAAGADASKTVPAAGVRSQSSAPNIVEFEQELLASFGDLAQDGPRGALRIGIMDAMAMYAYRPFWHTLFAKLGFSVVTASDDESPASTRALETIPSESVCYPAKLSHVRYFELFEKGCDAVFMPLYRRSFHCPVQTRYAKTLADNVSAGDRGDSAPVIMPELANYKPARFIRDEESLQHLLDAINDLIETRAPHVTQGELASALEEALDRQENVIAQIEKRTDEALRWLEADPARHGIVLAGRPYHMDKALLHSIDQELSRLGFAVLSASGMSELMAAQKGKKLGGAHPWIPAKRLVRLAHAIADDPQLDVVLLQSFGCGYEPLSLAEASDVLSAAGKPCTILTIDDISDVAHVRIRLRTLEAAIKERGDVRLLGQALAPDSASSQCRCGTRAPESGALKQSSQDRIARTPNLLEIPSKTHTGREGNLSSRKDIAPGSRIGIESRAAGKRASFLESIAAEPLNAKDLECARQRGMKDICFTANAMAARVIRMFEDDPSIRTIEIPEVCETCVTQAIPRIVERATGLAPEYVWTAWGNDSDEQGARTNNSCAKCQLMTDSSPKMSVSDHRWRQMSVSDQHSAHPLSQDPSKPRIGIVGNPLLVFEPFMNDGIVELIDELGAAPILPDPQLVTGEDVRYIEQLQAFQDAGIHDVIYLLSFGCLKGHVQGRGALRELRQLFPTMNITIIDYDPETSALNRENRIRLAVNAARENAGG